MRYTVFVSGVALRCTSVMKHVHGFTGPQNMQVEVGARSARDPSRCAPSCALVADRRHRVSSTRMGAKERKKPAPGRRWKRLAYPPTGGVELLHAGLQEALARGQTEFTQEELDGLQVEGLEWKSYIKVGAELYFQPLRPPRKDPPILVVAIGIFVLLSVYGFFWMLWKWSLHSYEFFAELDVASPVGAAIALASAAFVALTLYYMFYPEGQLARDAVAQRGAGRVTFGGGGGGASTLDESKREQ